MNFLAHLFLAESTPASRVGNLLGDFVTGRPEGLRERFPAEVLAGIVRHRTLDAWTDAHPALHGLKSCIAPERRRFAGAIIDVFFDHFLSRRWDDFSGELLRGFLGDCYAALRQFHPLLPEELGGDLEERLANDWLGHYDTLPGLEDVFARMARRRPAFAVLSQAVDDLRAHPQEFEAGFAEFFPAAIAQVKSLGPERNGL